MRSVSFGLFLVASLALGAGCSEKTKTETREAIDETGDAVGSAVEDTKENANKAADAVKAGAESARESWESDDAEPAPVVPPPRP